MAPPFKQVEFDIMFGGGICRAGDVLDLASENNIVEKSGAWYSYGSERIGQGREAAKQFLKDHPEMLKEVEDKVLKHFNVGQPAGAQPAQASVPPTAAVDEKSAKKTVPGKPAAAPGKKSGKPSDLDDALEEMM
jgi:recombination protein RecA